MNDNAELRSLVFTLPSSGRVEKNPRSADFSRGGSSAHIRRRRQRGRPSPESLLKARFPTLPGFAGRVKQFVATPQLKSCTTSSPRA